MTQRWRVSSSFYGTFCMCFASSEALHCVEHCCVRWKSTPSWIGHQWEVSGFKQTSSTADKKRALLFYLPSDNLRSLHKRQPPLKAFSLILLLDAAAARAGWPLLGVIHPEQPITFLPSCKKGDARLRILYLGRLGLSATLPLNTTHQELMCWAPWHCVCGTYISGISPMYSVLCIFVRVVAAVCASVQLFVWSRGSLLVEETWPTGRARSFCKMLAKQDPALSIQCSLPRNLLLSLLIMVSVFFRLFFNS